MSKEYLIEITDDEIETAVFLSTDDSEGLSVENLINKLVNKYTLLKRANHLKSHDYKFYYWIVLEKCMGSLNVNLKKLATLHKYLMACGAIFISKGGPIQMMESEVFFQKKNNVVKSDQRDRFSENFGDFLKNRFFLKKK